MPTIEKIALRSLRFIPRLIVGLWLSDSSSSAKLTGRSNAMPATPPPFFFYLLQLPLLRRLYLLPYKLNAHHHRGRVQIDTIGV